MLERFDRDLEHVTGQKAKDFGFDSAANMRQEISRAWEDASRQWLTFKSRKERLKETDKGTTETRTHWMMPFFSILNYNLEFQKEAEIVGEKLYEISHRDVQRDNFPILIISYRDGLDKKPEASRLRMSPHALLQDYLNNTEHTFGLVTNGLQLRLLRDTGRISKPVYAEFNLEKIFEESLYAEFVLLYRLLHASRMPQRKEQAAESIIEQYHQDAIESGGRIRDQLSNAMEHSIKALAKGLIQHPLNNELRQQIADGKLNEEQFYRILLRLIYRILFLMTIEERQLVYPELTPSPSGRAGEGLSDIYEKCYAIERLRKLAAIHHRVEGKQHDLWMRLLQTLRLFEEEKIANKLGLHALGTGLFAAGAIAPFDECKIANAVLLQAIFRLSYFENENKTMQRINYRQLDVEEFGSVYEGLLDYKIAFEKAVPADASRWDINLKSSTERGKSGTHYTPEELVQPLIKHSLDYLIADRKKIIDEKIKSNNLKRNANKEAREKLVEENLLTLKVCDVACGSGHILISAARRIAEACASIIEEEEQPNPVALRKAKRDVIRNCIYGVDMNPMAVELCKVALWLEAHNPCEPLNFLDHHIKCGDAIVGLAHRDELEKGIADEAFKTLPGDDKAIASALLKNNKAERKTPSQAQFDLKAEINAEVDVLVEEYKKFHHMPERTPDDVHARAKAHRHYEQDAHRIRLRQLADAQVAQFFIPKTTAHKDELLTDNGYRKYLREVKNHLGVLHGRPLAKAEVVGKEKRFFHWFLEFPEVFEQNGFDCILGNPPFLGDKKLKAYFGSEYLEWIKFQFQPIGVCDLVTYFFRRNFDLIKPKGFMSLISTNTISQGDAKEGGLDFIVTHNGEIVFADASVRWPGKAAVYISLIAITKAQWVHKKYLGKAEVTSISTLLKEGASLENPFTIIKNEEKSFIGNFLSCMGFTLEEKAAQDLILKDNRNQDVIFKFLNGEDLNQSFSQNASRWVINFFNWYLNEEQDIAEATKKDTEPVGHPYAVDYPDCLEIVEKFVKPERVKKNDKQSREKWWLHARPRINLYNQIREMQNVIVLARTSKTLAFCVAEKQVFSDSLVVFSLDKFYQFSQLQSSIHENWAWKYCTTMKTDLVYTPTNTFETYPFPQNLSPQTEQELEKIGEQYHEHRRQLMLLMQLGLTKTYSLFHLDGLTSVDIEARSKQPREASEKAYNDILTLRQLHKQMDEAVLAAYGWQDIALKHDFYEVDYLPENDRVRFTIHPDARKEILKRLLELNHKIHEEEVKAGLWEKKKTKKKDNTSMVNEPQEGYGGFFKEE